MKTTLGYCTKKRTNSREYYQFIAEYKDVYPIEKMCKVFKISRNSYYHWFSGKTGKRVQENKMYMKLIAEEFEKSKRRYGSTRIAKVLQYKGHRISQRRVAKLMRLLGLRSVVKKSYRVTTDSKHSYPISKNLLERNFMTCRLNEVWVSDITYIKTSSGWLYLTTIIDLYDRQVIGWSLSTSLSAKKTIVSAWNMATSKRKIVKSLIFHSDRGTQYACCEFRELLKKNSHIKQSMSRKGNCWDNAVAESFFKTLKTELVYVKKFKNQAVAKTELFEYIEIWYNRQRLHSTLGYKTPIQMEKEFLNHQNFVA